MSTQLLNELLSNSSFYGFAMQESYEVKKRHKVEKSHEAKESHEVKESYEVSRPNLMVRRPTGEGNATEDAFESSSTFECSFEADTPLGLPCFPLLKVGGVGIPSGSSLSPHPNLGSSGRSSSSFGSSSRSTSSFRRNTASCQDSPLVVTNKEGERSLVFEGEEDDDTEIKSARVLGRGAQGSVSLAQALIDSEGGTREVAIKTLNARTMGGTLHEQLTNTDDSSFDHKILKVMKVVDKEGKVYLVLPRFDVTLQEALKEVRILDESTHCMIALRVMQDCCQALRYMHSFVLADKVVGVVHRDIKPENIGLKIDGGPHWLVFDLDGAMPIGCSDTPAVFGSPKYMHPACYADDSKDNRLQLQPENDLFALGVTLLEMLGEETSTILPECYQDSFSGARSWKAERYNVEKANYTQALKEKQREKQSKDWIHYLTGTDRFPSPTRVYTTLTQDLATCATAKSKLCMIGMHLTRSFEQPKLSEIERFLSNIEQLIMDSFSLSHEAWSARESEFYQVLQSKKVRDEEERVASRPFSLGL